MRVVAALLTLATVTACGTAHTKAMPTATVTSTPTTTAATPGKTEPTGTVSMPSVGVRDKAAAKCKARIASQSKLSAYSKQTLESICSAAEASNASSVRQQESQACRTLVKTTVPPSYQAAALASCPKP
jgi:hypothetical protein